MQEGKTKFIKTTIILAILLVAILLIIAISQTFALKNLQKKSNSLQAKNNQIEQNISNIEKEIEIRETEDFTNDYLEQEEGYGNEKDVILKTP